MGKVQFFLSRNTVHPICLRKFPDIKLHINYFILKELGRNEI